MRIRSSLKAALSSVACVSVASLMFGKPVSAPEPQTGSEILWSIQKLDTLGRALYVAAHPDDENTSLISYLSLGRKYDTAYLSLTRGDGGQNLIGPELREKLGVIRTQELLEARKIDGGKQFFSRAKDFGYSKHPDETFRIWNREEVLSDTVWVIRQFQPDVIITRFNLQPGYTHGHHTASAILAVEAFEAAADPTRFPEQLQYVDTWQAERVVWNASSWFFRRGGNQFDADDYVSVDVGGFNPLLGKSYNEIASRSRSQHLSQGFGARIDRGSRTEYFQDVAGSPMGEDIFSGVDTRWSRVEGSNTVARKVSEIISGFEVTDPAASVPALLELRDELSGLELNEWASRKRAEVDAIILAAIGLDMRALTGSPYVANGEDVSLVLEAVNRSDLDVKVSSIAFPFAGVESSESFDLDFNQRFEKRFSGVIPADAPPPQPYWLRSEGSLGMFEVEDQMLIGNPENETSFYASVGLSVGGGQIDVKLPLEYREVDPAKGESIKPVLNLPSAAVVFETPVSLFPNSQSRIVEVKVSALLDDVAGELSLELPVGWTANPMVQKVDTIGKGGTRVFSFEVSPSERSEETELLAVLKSGGSMLAQSVDQIEYEHIREQMVFAQASTRAVSLKVARAGSRVGYLPGAGDSVADSIREIGYEVVELSVDSFDPESLVGLDTVVIGIRAYNTVEAIDSILPHLFKFAELGGTVIAQYNTSHRLKTDTVAPYRLSLSRDRVTDEFAEITVLDPEHPVMNTPNAIGRRDFDGWTQERGLYFPNSWDDAFQPIWSMSDPNEPKRKGSLLVAEHGEGYFVYTGISWFRQLPAGVPGAYRIFANLLSLGHENLDTAKL
ncbi:PIG-L family deacetylase [Pelagicoccus mobilis]|uniref:PIG-L family deacetylase n=1 Tax=Pelagicoccus mobilis TaxID=415221 RepID=A0A934VU07_9BACT|nr:PIG-L family deacetylase [Pelagicoccus mobilis]MBK1880268.1 PIG-L family deacetylase [Pelagicoccus mobilis]